MDVLHDRRSTLSEAEAMMSSADERGHPIASRTGADLRAARERLGWTLPDIAKHLRIRQPFLESIECGRIADLPGNAYAVGFVRTYAQALGLDPDEMARRFRAEAAEVNRKTPLAFPAPVPERGVPAGALVLVGLAVCIAAYVGWYRMSGDRPGQVPVIPVPDRLAILAEPPHRPEPVQAAAPAPIAEAPAPVRTLSSPTQAMAAQEAPPVAPPAISSAAPAAETAGLMLRARADSWLQVRDKQGAILVSRVLRAGETWPFPARGVTLVTTGNAGGTEMLLDGTPIGNFGADGVVRRDVAIDPDTIKDTKTVPAAAVAATTPARASPRAQ